MGFMKDILKENIPIWDECAAAPFVQELKNGTLPLEKFKHYIIQDSIYLKHYARIFGKAIYHSTKLKDIQRFYSILSFVSDTENVVRLNYLKQFDMTDDDVEGIDPQPENKSYIDFLVGVAEKGNICEILMAVLPCMFSYSYIFRKIAADPEARNSRYWDFIQDYTGEGYFAECKDWMAFADERCSSLPDDEKAALSLIFKKAGYLELDFWKMAYRG